MSRHSARAPLQQRLQLAVPPEIVTKLQAYAPWVARSCLRINIGYVTALCLQAARASKLQTNCQRDRGE